MRVALATRGAKRKLRDAASRRFAVAAARAMSDGVYYATVFDVVVATEHQKCGVGRLLMEGLLAKPPFKRVFLTSVFGKEDFYAKFGFLRQTNAMGLYEGPALTSAVQRGILQANA